MISLLQDITYTVYLVKRTIQSKNWSYKSLLANNHSKELRHKGGRLNCLGRYMTNRTITEQNSLPAHVVEGTGSIHIFKSPLAAFHAHA